VECWLDSVKTVPDTQGVQECLPSNKIGWRKQGVMSPWSQRITTGGKIGTLSPGARRGSELISGSSPLPGLLPGSS
jgi:hypothetical protein